MSHDHEHGHDHPPHLAHHFETPKQQFEAGKLGMWLFLATEILFFGGLFCGYAVLRGLHPELFQYGSRFLDTTYGAINTAVLIVSSLTMAAAVTFSQKGNQTALKACLALTVLGGMTFMVIKYFEYEHKLKAGLRPAGYMYTLPDFEVASHDGFQMGQPLYTKPLTELDLEQRKVDPSQTNLPSDVEVTNIPEPAEAQTGLNMSELEEQQRRREAGRASFLSEHGHDDFPHPLQDPNRPQNLHHFFTIYYLMTGLHGIHVVIGIGVISWLLVRSYMGDFGPEYFTPIDLVGLYWHVVDLVWIFLFPLFYLIH